MPPKVFNSTSFEDAHLLPGEMPCSLSLAAQCHPLVPKTLNSRHPIGTLGTSERMCSSTSDAASAPGPSVPAPVH